MPSAGRVVAERELARCVVRKCVAQVIYKIDIPANRYDLLCLEGISMALNVFRQKAEYPLFRVVRASHIALGCWSSHENRGTTRRPNRPAWENGKHHRFVGSSLSPKLCVLDSH